jgi:ABC-type dipeptide/oligopeptide/nickel transport system ATPase component
LIADEPTTALDVTVAAQILDLLVKLKNEFNIEFDFNGQSPSTVEEFSVFISKKINGGKDHE